MYNSNILRISRAKIESSSAIGSSSDRVAVRGILSTMLRNRICTSDRSGLPCPAGWHCFPNAGGYHLGDVAAAQLDFLVHEFEGPVFYPDFFRKRFKLFCPHHDRAKIKTKGQLDCATLPLARIPLAVGTVAPDDQATFNQRL